MSDSNLYVTCPKCNKRNPLGRVFCIGCGVRLPADGLIVGDVRRKALASKARSCLRRLVSFTIAVVLLGVLALALWPQVDGVESGDERHVERFRRDMGVFHQTLQRGQLQVRLVQTFEQADINAYLKTLQDTDPSGLETWLLLAPEGLRVRGVRPWFSLKVGAFTWRPRFSTEAVYTMHANGLQFEKAWFGHLYLPGVLGAPVGDFYARRLRKRPEWSVLRHLRCIEMGEGTITLALMPEH